MSNVLTTIPVIQPSSSNTQSSEPASPHSQDDAPDEPQVTVSNSAGDEPILAD